MIVRFSNYNAKSQLYKARINLRNVTFHDLGAEKIFINENLTAWRGRNYAVVILMFTIVNLFFGTIKNEEM